MIQTLTVGSNLRDTYTVLEKLGEGAFSEVFLVRHRFLGLQAMKVFKSNSHSPTSDQFKEAFILSKLAHPNIVRIFEANKIGVTSGARSYVTMEHAAGGTLHSFLYPSLGFDQILVFGFRSRFARPLSGSFP